MATKVKIGVVAVLAAAAVVGIWCLLPENDGGGSPSERTSAREAASPVAGRTGADAERGLADGSASDRELVPMVPAAGPFGLVVNAAPGHAVSGAAVVLTRRDGGGVLDRVESNAEGRFIFSRSMPPGPVWLAVQCRGFGDFVAEKDLRAGSVDLGAVELAPLWCIIGKVVDQNDRPVAGAELAGIRRAGTALDEQQNARKTSSGETGAFAFWTDEESNCDRELPKFVRARAGGLISDWVACSRREQVILLLGPVRTIHGAVAWTLDGSPVHGARIVFASASEPDRECPENPRTGSDGSFEIEMPDSGRDMQAEVFLFAPPANDPHPEPDGRVVVPRGVNDLGVIRIEGPTSLVVHVVESETRAPVAKAEVACASGKNQQIVATSGADGRAFFRGLPAEKSVAVSCWCDGFLLAGREVLLWTGPAGSEMSTDYALIKHPSWEAEEPEASRIPWGGTVRDRRGRPVSGADVIVDIDRSRLERSPQGPPAGADKLMQNRILFSPGGSRYGFFKPVVNTDESGRFGGIISRDFLDCPIEKLWILHPGYQPLWLKGEDLPEGLGGELTFVLDDIGAWIPGVICDARGVPLPECRVTCYYCPRELYRPENYSTGTAKYSSLTDIEGRFNTPGIPGAGLVSAASCRGFATGTFEALTDDLAPFGSKSIRIVLDKVERAPQTIPLRHGLQVRCVTDGGRPVERVEVRAWAEIGDDDSFARGVGGTLDYAVGWTGPDGRVRVEVDSLKPLPVQLALFCRSRFTGQDFIVNQTVAEMQAASDDNVLRYPSGQIVEVLVAPGGRAAPPSFELHSLPGGSVLKVVSVDTPRTYCLVREPENGRDEWCVFSCAIRRGGGCGAALAVGTYIRQGRYELVAQVPGYVEYTSKPFDVADSSETLPMIVELVPRP